MAPVQFVGMREDGMGQRVRFEHARRLRFGALRAGAVVAHAGDRFAAG
jgi:hypothetical protein